MKTISLLAAAIFLASSAMATEQTAPVPQVMPAPCGMTYLPLPDPEVLAKQQQAFAEQQAAAFQAAYPMGRGGFQDIGAEWERLMAEQQRAFEEGFKEHQQMAAEMARMHPEFGGPSAQSPFDGSTPPMAPVPGGMTRLSPEARRIEMRKHRDEQRQAMQARRGDSRQRVPAFRGEPCQSMGQTQAAGA